MKNRILNTGLAILFLLLATACNDIFEPRIKGSGNILTEERTPGTFDQIILEGSYEVEIVKGAEHSVVIEADDNIIPILRTNVSDGELKVYSRENYKPSERIKLLITVEQLESLTLRGSGDVRSSDEFSGNSFDLNLSGSGSIDVDVDVEQLDAHISGSGKFYIDGFARKQEVTISGSGKYYGSGLESEEARTSVSGSGSLYIYATEYLKASISGSGTIYYYGTPVIDSSISGSGNIVKKQ